MPRISLRQDLRSLSDLGLHSKVRVAGQPLLVVPLKLCRKDCRWSTSLNFQDDNMVAANESWLKRVDTTSTKVLFYALFWASHIGVFALGWYERTPQTIAGTFTDLEQVSPSHKHQASRAERSQVFGLDLKRRRPSPLCRRNFDPSSHVPECPAMASTADQMATA